MSLVGRSAIVTGAAGSIGRAITASLVDAGMRVLAVDIEPDSSAGGLPFEADLTKRSGNASAVQAAIDAFGRLDALVVNAGVQHVAPVHEFPEGTWDDMVALMLTSPFLLARYAWPHLARQGGRIVSIGSAHSLVASPYKSAYVAAKHGLLGLTRTLALEGAEVGVTATVVCPGFVRTPLLEKQLAAQSQAHGVPEERVLDDVVLAAHAVKRLIEPEEVASVVTFLLGPSGRAFTGVPVTMDLGWTAR